MSESFWESEEVIGQVPKGKDVIQVRRCSKRGKDYVDIRAFWRDDTGELRPGKGIALPADVIEKVIELVQEAVR